MSASEERIRILKLIESGQISPDEGSRLIEAVSEEPTARTRRTVSTPARSLRVQVTDLGTHRSKINVTIPVNLINIGLKLGARLIPRDSDSTIEELLQVVESGATGRIFELQNLEEGERIEIFVE